MRLLSGRRQQWITIAAIGSMAAIGSAVGYLVGTTGGASAAQTASPPGQFNDVGTIQAPDSTSAANCHLTFDPPTAGFSPTVDATDAFAAFQQMNLGTTGYTGLEASMSKAGDAIVPDVFLARSTQTDVGIVTGNGLTLTNQDVPTWVIRYHHVPITIYGPTTPDSGGSVTIEHRDEYVLVNPDTAAVLDVRTCPPQAGS